MTPEQLTGRETGHIVDAGQPGCQVHAGSRAVLLAMCQAARGAGFDPFAVSSFRSFDRQLTIWNDKFSGLRPVLDASGQPLDVLALDEDARVRAILLWSALPGASRHHWGTDVDLIDRNSVPPGYRVQLTAAEFDRGGPFEAFHEWLVRHAPEYGFFKPYRGVLSGVAAEPWHWSHAAVAEPARQQLTPDLLLQVLRDAPILGRQTLVQRVGALHARYVRDIDLPHLA